MAFKFAVLACALAIANGSYIHPQMGHHYSASTPQYGSQEVHYTTNSGGNSQGSTSQTESIHRGQENVQGHLNSNQQKAVQISSNQYSSQGKSDTHATNPGSYSTANYNSATGSTGTHEQQVISYTPTPSYNHPANRYEHPASSSYQQSTQVYGGHSSPNYVQPTPVYGHSNGAVYGHHSVPVYHYTSSSYGQGESGYSHGASAPSYQHPVQGYSQVGSSSGNAGLIDVPYSPAVSVSHMSYTSPVGVSYAW